MSTYIGKEWGTPTAGELPPWARAGIGTKGQTSLSKKWYKGWLDKFGGRGRYGGGKEVFDMAKGLAKGEGPLYNKLMAEAATPFVTAGLNAGRDYMRATGARESSSGGNAQAGLLATLAAGRGGMAGTEAVSGRLRDLTGLSAEERARLGLEIGEETDYRDFLSNERQMEFMRKLQLMSRNGGGGGGGGVYAGGGGDPYAFSTFQNRPAFGGSAPINGNAATQPVSAGSGMQWPTSGQWQGPLPDPNRRG